MNKKKSSIVDPLVIVEVFGVPADCAKKETHHIENNGAVPGSAHSDLKAASFGSQFYRLRRVKSFFFPRFQGFNPAWNENLQFDVYVPELALVRFLIEDHDSTSDNEFVAQYTLPFSSLAMGESARPPYNRGSVAS